MSITVTMKPELEAELSRLAAAHGADLGAYAASLLEDAVHADDASRNISPEQFDRTLEELAQFSEKIPLLPNEAFSRESLYRDHD